VGADLPGADDQGRLRDQALQPRPALGPPEQDATADHVDHPEEPGAGQDGRRLGAGLEQGGGGDQRDGGQRGGCRHLRHAVRDPELDRVAIEPPGPQQSEDERGERPDQGATVVAGARGVRADQGGHVRERQEDAVRRESQREPAAPLE